MSEIIERDNPLTRHLNAIAKLNEQHGARAEGGTGVPTVRQESSGGISLPPAERITAEEEAELQAAWQAEQAGRNLPPENFAAPQTGFEPVFGSKRNGALTDFVLFDLTNAVLIGNNDDRFPLSTEMLKSLRVFGFMVAREVIAQQLKAMADNLGIDLTAPVGGQGGTDGKEVPPVRPNEAS